MKSYASLKTILINKLTALEGKDEEPLFAGVYGVMETEPAGYPMCVVMESAGSGEILDTQRNQREWQFEVTLVQEIGTKTPESAYEALLDATDRVIDAFDQDPMLKDEHDASQCLYCKVVPSEFNLIDGGYQINKITVAIMNVVNRYSTA